MITILTIAVVALTIHAIYLHMVMDAQDRYMEAVHEHLMVKDTQFFTNVVVAVKKMMTAPKKRATKTKKQKA